MISITTTVTAGFKAFNENEKNNISNKTNSKKKIILVLIRFRRISNNINSDNKKY